MVARSDQRPPWKRSNPKRKSTSLSPARKAEARARARAAGRKYPNLVDNMAVARKKKTDAGKTVAKRTAKTTRARKRDSSS